MLCSIYNLGVEWFLFASAEQLLCNNAGITHPDVYVVYTDKDDILKLITGATVVAYCDEKNFLGLFSRSTYETSF